MSKLTLSFKGKMLKVAKVTDGEMTIGSDPSCQLHIDSLAVQPKHATITTHNDESVLRDLGTSDGTLVNGKKVEEHTLIEGDQIQVGKHTLKFTFVPSANEALDDEGEGFQEALKASHRKAWLQILTGNNVGKTISLKNSITNLGKAGVQTAVIARRGEGYFITHLEGEHSPKVDGSPIGNESTTAELMKWMPVKASIRTSFFSRLKRSASSPNPHTLIAASTATWLNAGQSCKSRLTSAPDFRC